jgi:hypothetical protein
MAAQKARMRFSGPKSDVPRPSSLLARIFRPILFALAVLTGWRPQRDSLYETERNRPPSRPDRVFGKVVLGLAAQDWLLLAYLVVLLVGVVYGGGSRRVTALACLSGDLGVFLLVLFVVRWRTLTPSLPKAIGYRLAIFVPVLGSFLQLQYILPAASGPAVDARLYALDLHLFGVEPAVAWDRFVTPATTEWFAFFYYGYFFLIALHVFPMMILSSNVRTLNAFSFGFIWVYCVGHVLYTFVPALGPYAYLSGHFRHELDGPFWWQLVKQAVASVDGGARTDVFPSLHTAVPSFIAAFSFQHRKDSPFRYSWLPLALFTTQIIAATMFLRWHYAIDVVAGLVLAGSALAVTRVALWWDEARVLAGGPAVWPVLKRNGRPRRRSESPVDATAR